MATKKVAVVLAGCGFLDGAEIFEATAALIALDRKDVAFQVFAPDKHQADVIDHVRQQPTSEKRNVMHEAARIARGNIKPLSMLQMTDWDALVIPGGYGAAKNLVDYALKGLSCSVDEELDRAVKQAHALKKPIGAICIAPMIVARSLGADHHPTVTLGDPCGPADDAVKLGAKHVKASPTEIVVDEANKIVSTPAYMNATRIKDVFEGVSKLVDKVIAMA